MLIKNLCNQTESPRHSGQAGEHVYRAMAIDPSMCTKKTGHSNPEYLDVFFGWPWYANTQSSWEYLSIDETCILSCLQHCRIDVSIEFFSCQRVRVPFLRNFTAWVSYRLSSDGWIWVWFAGSLHTKRSTTPPQEIQLFLGCWIRGDLFVWKICSQRYFLDI